MFTEGEGSEVCAVYARSGLIAGAKSAGKGTILFLNWRSAGEEDREPFLARQSGGGSIGELPLVPISR